MMPFPPKLLEVYPFDSARCAERPWWTMTPSFVWTRADGLVVSYRDARVATIAAPFAIPVGLSLQIPQDLDKVALAAWFDARVPMKHPGFRPGQVWASAEGDAVMVRAVIGGLPYEDTDDVRHIRTQEVYPFLVYDAVRPHLAPWSPVAVSTP